MNQIGTVEDSVRVDVSRFENFDFSTIKDPPKPNLREQMHSSKGGRISRQEVVKRAGNAMLRKLPTYRECENTSREWAIIGGGPSIIHHVEVIRQLKKNGVNIVSVNKSHDWLLEHGIVPFAHVLLDPKEWVADYVKRPRKDVRYFVASQCHDNTFDALKDYNVFLWHSGQDFEEGDEPSTYLRTYWRNTPWYVLPGPTTVGLRAMNVGHGLGADHFHLIGLDSSRALGKLHGYEKTEAPDATSGMFYLKNRNYSATFDTNSHMLKQLYDFDEILKDLPEHHKSGQLRPDFCMTVYGSGMLPFYAATLGLHADPKCNADPYAVGGLYFPEDDSPIFNPVLLDSLEVDMTNFFKQLSSEREDAA